MASLFEFCFYVGILLTLAGLIWLGKTLLAGRFRKALAPLAVLLVGIALLVGPAIISRKMAVDLGPRESIVSNERHVSLTGWDGQGYEFLADKSDTVVLQMANGDVADATLDQLVGMNQLRELDLNDTQITDFGLSKLASLPKLQTLRLRNTKITDAGFRESLMSLPLLKQLDVRETGVSTATIDEWKNAAENRRALQ